MKMPALLLLLAALVKGGEVICKTGDVVEVALPVLPTSGFIWVYEEGGMPVNGVKGEYRSLPEGSGQLFQLMCPAEETETCFSLQAPWSTSAQSHQSFRLSPIPGHKSEP